jgi:hypothetical protein
MVDTTALKAVALKGRTGSIPVVSKKKGFFKTF